MDIKKDPLSEALEKSSYYSIKVPESEFFRETTKKLDLEYFYLSWKQRIMCFIGSFALGSLLFFYSISRLFFRLGSPTAFGFPYALSNLIFFFSYGFIKGFKTYFKGLFKASKVKITLPFIINTFLTLYFTYIGYSFFLSLGLVILQIGLFISFIFRCLPEKLSGITSLFGIFLRSE